jgi:hypothetical protein
MGDVVDVEERVKWDGGKKGWVRGKCRTLTFNVNAITT